MLLKQAPSFVQARKVRKSNKNWSDYILMIGVAWEYIILLGNTLHQVRKVEVLFYIVNLKFQDVWINIPISATGSETNDTTSYIYLNLVLAYKSYIFWHVCT